MSLHPSLRVDTAGSQQRTVLTRIERIKDLMKKGLWQDDQSVVGLPKTKIVKVKARKTKVKTDEDKAEEKETA
ncbi:MAG: small basic protein [Candidatus Omnitrophica bacterium]|nr:small basic protein [Candidatus Omnitrophota bacterium]